MITANDLDQMGYWEEEQQFNDHIGKTPLDMVTEFAQVTEQEPSEVLYATLIQEEFEEWRSSYLQNDKLNELKEMADLVYVVYGLAAARGWNMDEAVRRVHENNLGRVVQDDGTILRRDDGKIIKNPNAPKIELEDLL